MIGQVFLNVLYSIGQLLVVIFLLIALFTNQWIRNVIAQGEEDFYFQKVSRLYEDTFLSGNVFTSIGLWRLLEEGGLSYALPIIDTELRYVKAALFCGLAMGCGCLYVSSFQLFRLFNKNPGLELIIGWSTFIQTIFTISAAAVGMSYFNNNFDYDNFGLSLYAAWIAVVVGVVLLPACVFRVRFAKSELDKYEKEKKSNTYKPAPTYEKMSIRSGSENRLYNPPPQTGSRPGTAERSHHYHTESRQGTMQSPRPQENPMRRTPSYDSKQFDMEDYRPRMYMDYNDQGDIPRHIR